MAYKLRCLCLLLAVLGLAAMVQVQAEEASIKGQIKAQMARAAAKAHKRGKEMKKKAMSELKRGTTTVFAKGERGTGAKKPPPIFADDSLPCNEGGGDCSDYDYEGDCNTWRCNRAKKYCMSRPTVGASCTSFFADDCNKGPGKCRVYPGDITYGYCVGTPVEGGSCDDYNDCTENDTCKIGRDSGGEVGICEGSFKVGASCDDGDECTSGDKCVVQHDKREPDYITCEGKPQPGAPCDDYNDCTSNDECKLGDDYTFCEGKIDLSASCDDYDDCTKNDKCVLYESDYGDSAYCQGDPAPGASCNDDNECTDNDKCKLGDSGDYAYCTGDPKQGGTCDDYDDCTVNDTCKISSDNYGDYAYCEGTYDANAPGCNSRRLQ